MVLLMLDVVVVVVESRGVNLGVIYFLWINLFLTLDVIMTRHARNCTAGAVYTYHEKKKDAEASGYGTERQRLGKDSIKNFDCCCLTLQRCRNPVIS